MAPRCFVSAPADATVAPLVLALEARGWDPFLLSDVAELGASLTEAVQDAIRGADLVIGVIGEGAHSSANTAFELGFAAALGKPVAVVVSPGAAVPSDLHSFLYIHADPDNVDAMALALDNLERYRYRSHSERPQPSSATPIGAYADQLLQQARALRNAPATEFEELVRRGIEASGAVAVTSAGHDRGFDLGVWSDDLDAIGGNPLLVELKHRVDPESVRQSLNALHQTPSARVVLVVVLDPTSPVDVAGLKWPLLSISLAELLERMRSEPFPEVVRDLRNRSVHSLPR